MEKSINNVILVLHVVAFFLATGCNDSSTKESQKLSQQKVASVYDVRSKPNPESAMEYVNWSEINTLEDVQLNISFLVRNDFDNTFDAVISNAPSNLRNQLLEYCLEFPPKNIEEKIITKLQTTGYPEDETAAFNYFNKIKTEVDTEKLQSLLSLFQDSPILNQIENAYIEAWLHKVSLQDFLKEVENNKSLQKIKDAKEIALMQTILTKPSQIIANFDSFTVEQKQFVFGAGGLAQVFAKSKPSELESNFIINYSKEINDFSYAGIFLSNWGNQNPYKALQWVKSISDTELKNEILNSSLKFQLNQDFTKKLLHLQSSHEKN